MKALPRQQRRLLELQQTDSAVARFLYQENTHPAKKKLAALQGRQEDLRRAVIAANADLDGYNRRIKQQEKEIARVEDRRILQQERLDGGKVPLRDMSALEHEIGNIESRIQTLEGEVLDLMETAEKLQEAIAATESNAAQIGEDEALTVGEMERDLEGIRSERKKLEEKREDIRAEIPQPVLALYDRTQARLGPMVVIEVRNGAVVNSPVELPLAELSRLNTLGPDDLYVSDESEHIVVRTNSA